MNNNNNKRETKTWTNISFIFQTHYPFCHPFYMIPGAALTMSGTAAGAVTVSLSHSSTLTGSTEHARDSSKPIYSFRGLRYALPPVGDLRFKPPQHAPPPEGRIDATQFGKLIFPRQGSLAATSGEAEPCVGR